jgi:mono/diheme cytochrome c family protein
MRKVQLKQATLSTIGIVAVAIIVLAGLRAWVTAELPSDQGAMLFQKKGCVGCHFTDSRKTKFGPGLKGLFDRQHLPESGRPATAENVRRQLIDPYQKMPSFADKLTDEQMDAIIQYLETL